MSAHCVFRPLLAGIFALCLAGPVLAVHDHSGYFTNGFLDARNCIVCHKEMANEVIDSVHYQWRSENPNVEFPGGGAHGMIDRACGLVGSNALINYDESCGRCHVSNTLPFPQGPDGTYTQQQKWSVDCLICHAQTYDMNNDGIALHDERADDRVRVYDPNLEREVWAQDHSQASAETVGSRVTNEACLRCHHHGQADYTYKRGTPYEPEHDVHAAAGLYCTDCHATAHHKIARGSRVTDMYAWERQDVEVRCENCHATGQLHQELPYLNRHLDVIGCETCHIPEVAGAERRVWAPTMGAAGPESNVPVFNAETGQYEPHTEYTEGPVAPEYRWFAGGASMLAEPIDQPGAFNMQPANRATPGARILPFRSFVSGQPMDGRGLPGMPGFDPNFTMKAALDQMAPALTQMGFMRPEGLTDAEAAMMSQFPNMLYFDRAHYFGTGNVSEAVSLGMGKMGALMQGMDITRMTQNELMSMGSQMWSGEVAGLDLPNNPYDPTYIDDPDPTTVTGSFIAVNHAIKRDGALSCQDCHTPDGRLDFALLGYNEVEVTVLESPLWNAGRDHSLFISEYKGPGQCVVCHEGKIEEVQATTHYRFESTVPDGHLFDENGTPVAHAYTGKLWKVCGFPTALAQANWLGNLADDPATPHVDVPGGCGQCHVGIGMKSFSALGQAQPQPSEAINVDCLVCHAENYVRRVYNSITNGQPDGAVFTVPRLDGDFDFSIQTAAAQSVGSTTADACQRCHAAAGGGSFSIDDHHQTSFKRGDLYEPGYDVHATAGMTCSDCHDAGKHRMKRPLNNDLSAHDVVVEHQMCLDCHGSNPHLSEPMYNFHTGYIACTTCHASSRGGAIHKDFSIARAPDPDNPLALWKPGLTLRNEDYPFTFAWFNGQSEPEIEPVGSRGDGLIYPYKTATFNQPLDAEGHPIPIKWGIFFKTGNMQKAIETGRTLYSQMWTESLGERTGLPATPGEFDHFGEHTVKFSISHGIRKNGALTCSDCHQLQGDMDFATLGYSSSEVQFLINPWQNASTDWLFYR